MIGPTGAVRVMVETIRYALSRWEGLTRFIDDGRIELDNNTVERSIRPIALSRKNALFAGSDGGAKHWVTVASLIETCKLNDVEPPASPYAIMRRVHPYRGENNGPGKDDRWRA